MAVPLCVDLDGTIIKTDSLFELFLILIKKNPSTLFVCCLWLLRGKAYLKYQIAQHASLNCALLPFSKHFLAYLNAEYKKGRELILVTGANTRIATAVAEYLGIFSKILASDAHRNLTGNQKRKLLTDLFGPKQFDYAGNHKTDVIIWNAARKAIIVNANKKIIAKVKENNPNSEIFPVEKKPIHAFFKAIRFHQNAKNMLIFAPLLLSHRYLEINSIIHSLIAFLAFCLIATSVYLTNDLLDLEADRQHTTKQMRPFAAGDLSIQCGILLAFIFAVAALLLAQFLHPDFMFMLLSYFFITMSYSFYFKRKLLVDVFVLAILYTLRIIAGTEALQNEYSEWLITFSLFFFLSLAFAKRYSELFILKGENKHISYGRSYLVADLTQLSLFGTVSGYVASLVFAFYINSSKVIILYHHPEWLWAICLFLLYWISRIWLLASRGLLHEDPVTFALTDRTSLIILLIMVVILITASL